MILKFTLLLFWAWWIAIVIGSVVAALLIAKGLFLLFIRLIELWVKSNKKKMTK
jgi:hypothetical protein